MKNKWPLLVAFLGNIKRRVLFNGESLVALNRRNTLTAKGLLPFLSPTFLASTWGPGCLTYCPMASPMARAMPLAQ